MASRAPQTPTLRALRFIEANKASPLRYQSWDDTAERMTFTLANGQKFELSTADCLSIRSYVPRWAHLMEAA